MIFWRKYAIYIGKSDDFCMVLNGTVDDSQFPEKPVKFSWKNRQIFIKKLTNFHEKIDRFSLKNRKIVGKVYNAFRKIVG